MKEPFVRTCRQPYKQIPMQGSTGQWFNVDRLEAFDGKAEPDLAVNFAYKPYPGQIDFMAEMVRAIIGRKNAALESPTGTGKTLCMLSASIAASN